MKIDEVHLHIWRESRQTSSAEGLCFLHCDILYYSCKGAAKTSYSTQQFCTYQTEVEFARKQTCVIQRQLLSLLSEAIWHYRHHSGLLPTTAEVWRGMA